MKKLLSILSGRLMFLVFPVALAVSFLLPANTLASKEMSQGGGGPGGSEGDPLDTNDYSGGGGGGGGSEVHDQSSAGSVWNLIELEQFRILLVPEYVGGTLIFKVLFLAGDDFSAAEMSVEGTHAP